MVVQRTAHGIWLIGHNTHNLARHAAPSHYRVGSKILLHLKEASLVHNTVDHFFYIVGVTGIIRHDILKLGSLCPDNIVLPCALASAKYLSHSGGKALSLRRIDNRRLLCPVAGQIGQEFSHAHQALVFRIIGKMRDAALLCMHLSAAKLLHRHFLIDYRLHHVGPGNKHFGDILHHKNKIADGRRIAGPSRAGSQNHGYLGNHAGGLRMPQKHAAVAA